MGSDCTAELLFAPNDDQCIFFTDIICFKSTIKNLTIQTTSMPMSAKTGHFFRSALFAFHPPQSYCADYAAGNFAACVSGWLGCKVIGITVNDHRSADDVPDPKPVRHNGKPCFPIARQQRRKIPRVLWMRHATRIVMAAGIRETGFSAVPSLMDMKREKFFCRLWKSVHRNNHQCSITVRIE